MIPSLFIRQDRRFRLVSDILLKKGVSQIQARHESRITPTDVADSMDAPSLGRDTYWEGSGFARAGCSSNLSSEVHFFLLNAFANFETHEADKITTAGFNQLTNGLIRILDERLLNQAVLGKELLDPATHHLLDDFGRLAFHIWLGLDDRFFFFQLFFRHVLRLANARINRSNVHGNIASCFSIAGAQRDNRCDLVVAVDVAANNRAFNTNNATNGNVLTDLLNQSFTLGFKFAFHQRLNVSHALAERNVQQLVGKVHEVVVTSNKVSLGVHFQNVGNGIVVRHTDQ